MPMDTFDLEPDEVQPLTGLDLINEVAFYKRTADHNGEPYDPEWDQWLANDPAASAILAKLKTR